MVLIQERLTSCTFSTVLVSVNHSDNSRSNPFLYNWNELIFLEIENLVSLVENDLSNNGFVRIKLHWNIYLHPTNSNNFSSIRSLQIYEIIASETREKAIYREDINVTDAICAKTNNTYSSCNYTTKIQRDKFFPLACKNYKLQLDDQPNNVNNFTTGRLRTILLSCKFIWITLDI